MKWLIAVLLRGGVLAGIWLGLSAAEPQYLAYGAVSVAAATALSLLLLPPQAASRGLPRRAVALLVLTGWFLWRLLLGGIDVAARAVGPSRMVDPVIHTEPARLSSATAHTIAVLLMGLLPGSFIQREFPVFPRQDDFPGQDDAATSHAEATAQRDTAQAASPTANRTAQGATSVEIHALSRDLDVPGQWRTLQRLIERIL